MHCSKLIVPWPTFLIAEQRIFCHWHVLTLPSWLQCQTVFLLEQAPLFRYTNWFLNKNIPAVVFLYVKFWLREGSCLAWVFAISTVSGVASIPNTFPWSLAALYHVRYDIHLCVYGFTSQKMPGPLPTSRTSSPWNRAYLFLFCLSAWIS